MIKQKQVAQVLVAVALFTGIGHGFKKVGHGIAYPFHSHKKPVKPIKK